jgi:hypothetical protein
VAGALLLKMARACQSKLAREHPIAADSKKRHLDTSMREAGARPAHTVSRTDRWLLSVTVLALAACSPAMPPSPTQPAASATTFPSPTALPRPAPATPRPTLPPDDHPLPSPTASQARVVATLAAGAQAAQATSAAIVPTVATVVAGVVQSEQVQDTVRQIAAVLGGIGLEVDQTPPGAAPLDTMRMVLRGSDTGGALASLQPFARRLAALAALATAGQLFPNADIELTVVDASGATLLSGSRRPGHEPEVIFSG